LSGKSDGGLGTFAESLKPALARGEFPCIGATTVSEYRRHIESDPALARRFTPVRVEEPSPEETIAIAKQVSQEHLAASHGVTYDDEAIAEAVRLAVRYLHDEFLPGKVIKLLDQAGPRLKMGGSLRRYPVDPKQATSMVEVIRQIVSERTGIPLTSLSLSDKAKLLGLEEELKIRVKGQDEAIREVARVVKRARAQLSDPRRPQGVFLFTGPTGVGKTELALALTEALFDEEDAILRLDMSEYMEKHNISRLIGSPPGYIGHDEEGQLTGRLRRRPYSVVLLDEIEKAHRDVQHLFLQLFDAGRITDSHGYVADGRNAIFIMTTNLGAKEALGFAAETKSYEQKLRAAVEAHFTPEFLNRVNCVVYFKPLTDELLLAIFDKFFTRAILRFKEQNIEIEVSEAYKRDLCARFTDPKRGARPLQRAIENEIIAPLTDKILSEEIRPGMKIVIDITGKITENTSQPEEQSKQQSAPEHDEPQISDQGAEKDNEAVLSQLETELVAEYRAYQIEIHINEGAREILCSPLWADWRNNLPTRLAFEKLVREPLHSQYASGQIKAGDHVKIVRNIDRIDIKKLDGGQ
jgi:ATP-dependent Clp protease ATP-binding subunit ClpC